jgi:hypothetical protein
MIQSTNANAARLSFLVIITVSAVWFLETAAVGATISHDLSSYLAPAVSLVNGTGAPYVDYFDVKPPALIFLLVPWVWAIGHSLLSMLVLDSILLTGMLLLFLACLNRISTGLVRDAAYIFALGVSITTNQFTMFFLSETLGNFLIFAAFALLFFARSYAAAWFLSGLLLFLAGQVKEVYFFAVLATMFLAGWQGRPVWVELGLVILGWVAGLTTILALLVVVDALSAYVEVLRYKATIFRLGGLQAIFGQTVQLLYVLSLSKTKLWFVILTSILALAFIWRQAVGSRDLLRDVVTFQEGRLAASAILFFAIAFGFVWQGKPPASNHYIVSPWFPFVLAISGWLTYVSGKLMETAPTTIPNISKRSVSAFVQLWVLICLFPGLGVLPALSEQVSARTKAGSLGIPILEAPAALGLYLTAMKYLPADGCLQQIYGWDAGAAHIYTRSSPCSRFFIANLITTTTNKAEYRSELMQSPPAVVIYSPGGADLDVEAFERTVFPWKRVLDSCYFKTASPIVYATSKPRELLKSCIADQL